MNELGRFEFIEQSSWPVRCELCSCNTDSLIFFGRIRRDLEEPIMLCLNTTARCAKDSNGSQISVRQTICLGLPLPWINQDKQVRSGINATLLFMNRGVARLLGSSPMATSIAVHLVELDCLALCGHVVCHLCVAA